jgi:cobaltochelatase CobN
MHLLATTSGVIDGAAEAVDLQQDTGDIVILTAADSEIAMLASALDSFPESDPTVRLVNLMRLQHHMSVDTYVEKTLANARLIVVRLLGGKSYWPYGIESLIELARENDIKLVVIAGEPSFDAQLSSLSNVNAATCNQLQGYLTKGGPENARLFLQACFHVLGRGEQALPPVEFPRCGIYLQTTGPICAAILFYRSVAESGQTAPIDGLADALVQAGLAVVALFVPSLKDDEARSFITSTFANNVPDVIINATAFAVGNETDDPLAQFGCTVLQVSLAGTSEIDWRQSSSGLSAKDLAMSVVMPELDGRVFARAISFKADETWHARSQCSIVTHKPVVDRIAHVAALASRWVQLRRAANADKRIAIILANYPNKNGRIANGVGLDTPASTIGVLRELRSVGYQTGELPQTGNELIEKLKAGQTNSSDKRMSEITFSIQHYTLYLNSLPSSVKAAVELRWGQPANDPFVIDASFHLPLIAFGNIIIGVQPARGYNIDPKATYHDPGLVPPHGYFATYFWLREVFGVDAIIHMGKHGNLEWLPGKTTALSAECYPEAVLGPVPQLYPFIVNDPGEGTQAKRRTSAVIVDHLIPPLARAETYGPLKDLEAMVDEYYLAAGLDRRRLAALRVHIMALAKSERLDMDAGFDSDDDGNLQKLDAFLCDLKEAQIRDGLHVFGTSPQGDLETNLLVALTRTDKNSLIRALSNDLGLAPFDPLSCRFTDEWKGPRPDTLQHITSDPWRTAADTVERLELLAVEALQNNWHLGEQSRKALDYTTQTLRPVLSACGEREMTALLDGLNGSRISPGPSGAPTRGKLDVLPTGRNFYSLDNRTLPTPAAWELGKASASALLTRHFQDTGNHLQTAALSAWGTCNMRTGGDDIAQAMALIGVAPKWDPASWRVTGFEITPLAKLNRPRVDITLRISGFFRDAFPAQIELLDKAITAVASLEEPADENPIAARAKSEVLELVLAGVETDTAMAMASARIFGSKPGSYGAGLQALIDEGGWKTRGDLASAFITWGAYVYGARSQGRNDEKSFKRRLANVQAVIHNQDNREHDLLDSDDYYQFEGGMSAAVETHGGVKPQIYHNDHSRPERPIVRTLEEEIARVVRSRVVNPKWINGVKRHGYKGAFEIAATVDYMFAFAATTNAVKSHHFDIAYDAYLGNASTRDFIASNNPSALREIAARFSEAMARGLWQPRLNSAHDHLKELQT